MFQKKLHRLNFEGVDGELMGETTNFLGRRVPKKSNCDALFKLISSEMCFFFPDQAPKAAEAIHNIH